MSKWKTIPDDQTLEKTVAALKENGVNAIVVENGEEAKQKFHEIIPEGAEVMDMTSITLSTLGLDKHIQESGKHDSVKVKLSKMNREEHHSQMQRIGAAPQWAVGSVHAVTEDGKVIVASNTGSQLSAYVYGAPHVLWIVGAQKVVKDLEEGLDRVYEHVLPLESDRARKAYGVEKSNVSKLFILNKEVNPSRITMILVKEPLGF